MTIVYSARNTKTAEMVADAEGVVMNFVVVFVLKPDIIYLRYLLVCIPFILLLLSSLGARLWRCCKWGKLAALILLGLVVYQNGARNYKLMGNGRGNYLKALQFISQRDPSPTIDVTGNNRVHIGEVGVTIASFPLTHALTCEPSLSFK